VAGSGLTRSTNNSGDETGPAWSPDGTKIAFDSMRDGNAEIYIMNADGSAQTRITQNSAGDMFTVWQPYTR
jgi:Tol biopolymer transport system component